MTVLWELAQIRAYMAMPEVRFYLEVIPKEINPKDYIRLNSDKALIFVKEFDPATASLRYFLYRYFYLCLDLSSICM